MNLPLFAKKEKAQIVTNEKFPFLCMKMSWYLVGDLQFGLLSIKGHRLKYVGKVSIHTPGTLHAIPSILLNGLANSSQENPLFIIKGHTMPTWTMQTPSVMWD